MDGRGARATAGPGPGCPGAANGGGRRAGRTGAASSTAAPGRARGGTQAPAVGHSPRGQHLVLAGHVRGRRGEKRTRSARSAPARANAGRPSVRSGRRLGHGHGRVRAGSGCARGVVTAMVSAGLMRPWCFGQAKNQRDTAPFGSGCGSPRVARPRRQVAPGQQQGPCALHSPAARPHTSPPGLGSTQVRKNRGHARPTWTREEQKWRLAWLPAARGPCPPAPGLGQQGHCGHVSSTSSSDERGTFHQAPAPPRRSRSHRGAAPAQLADHRAPTAFRRPRFPRPGVPVPRALPASLDGRATRPSQALSAQMVARRRPALCHAVRDRCPPDTARPN
jgi:hypothetical protein